MCRGAGIVPRNSELRRLQYDDCFKGCRRPNDLAPPPPFASPSARVCVCIYIYTYIYIYIYISSAFQPPSRKLLNSLLMTPMVCARAPFRAL